MLANDYGIKSYGVLKKLTVGKGLEVHHLIEKRFAETLGLNSNSIPSIALTKEDRQIFKYAWKDVIGRSNSKNILNTRTATISDIKDAAYTVYKDYPTILKELEKLFKSIGN